MSQTFIGEIHIFGFNFAPRGYALCQGQTLPIAQYSALFSLLGTTYGGNGQSTFQLPDLRSRVPNGQGQGPGLQPYQMGQQAGTEQTTLTQAQMPQHTHTWTNNNSALNARQTKGTAQEPAVGSQLGRLVEAGGTNPVIYVPTGSTADQVALGGLNVAGTNSIAGGSQPFSILQPYLTLNFSIALQGIFPSRN